MAKLESLIELLDRSRKRLALGFCIAILIHLPLTPGMPMLSFVQRMTDRKAKQASPPAPPREIEVELQEALRSEEKRLQNEKLEASSKAASVQIEAPANVRLAKGEPNPKDAKSEAKPESTNKTEAKKQVRKTKVRDLGLEGELASKLVYRPA